MILRESVGKQPAAHPQRKPSQRELGGFLVFRERPILTGLPSQGTGFGFLFHSRKFSAGLVGPFPFFAYFRSLKKTALDRYFDDPVDSDKDGNNLCLIDMIAGGEDVSDRIELLIRCEQLYKYIESELDEREKQIIRLRYGLQDGRALTQREVADKLGISRSYVSRIEKKALCSLRSKYEGK